MSEVSEPKTEPITPPTAEGWRKLAAEFPEDQIEHKPQPIISVRQGDTPTPKGRCVEGEKVNTSWGVKPISVDGYHCGNWHAPSVHLAYVGHAGLTMRLNDVCTPAGWDWQPVVKNQDGSPYISKDGMWITLTIWGVTKLGFGDAQGKVGGNAIKEIIGDALRNAAMRFGVATYLWSKSEKSRSLAGVEEETPRQQATQTHAQDRPRPEQPAQPREQAPQPPAEPAAPPDPLTAAKYRALNASLLVKPRGTDETQVERGDWILGQLGERGLFDTAEGFNDLAAEWENAHEPVNPRI